MNAFTRSIRPALVALVLMLPVSALAEPKVPRIGLLRAGQVPTSNRSTFCFVGGGLDTALDPDGVLVGPIRPVLHDLEAECLEESVNSLQDIFRR